MNEPSKIDPMSFLHLDMLANTLLDTTKELEEEFNTKMKFLHEQETTWLKNANEIACTGQFLDTLRYCIYQTEQELCQNEVELLDAEKLIEDYEKIYSKFSWPHKQRQPMNHNNTLVLLKLLLSADSSAAQCKKLKEEVEQFNAEVAVQFKPCKMIGQILQCHTELLKEMEKQLDQLESMTREVNRNYAMIKENLQINSLSTRCICEMAKSIGKLLPKKA